MAVYAFQGARIMQVSPRLSFDYEWNFGASFGWKKYDGQYYPQNEVIGSKINAYINLGLVLNWQLHPQWKLAAGVDLTHFSNGNTHYPNGDLMLLEEESEWYVRSVKRMHPQMFPNAFM